MDEQGERILKNAAIRVGYNELLDENQKLKLQIEESRKRLESWAVTAEGYCKLCGKDGGIVTEHYLDCPIQPLIQKSNESVICAGCGGTGHANGNMDAAPMSCEFCDGGGEVKKTIRRCLTETTSGLRTERITPNMTNADNYGPGLCDELIKLVYWERRIRLLQRHWTNRYGFNVKLECPKDCPVCKQDTKD